MRCVRTRVFPEPAPARIRSGPSPCSTASRWGSFSPWRSVSAAAMAIAGEDRAMPGLCDQVREYCARIAERAEHVRGALGAADALEPGPEPSLDPKRPYLDGSPDEVRTYLLTL